MAMSKRTKVILIVIVLAVAAYLVYRWYENNQANQPAAGDTLGSNLNSPAPVLEGGSDSGDNSAPSYSAGTETIDVNLPNGDQSTSSSSGTKNKVPAKKPIPKTKPPVKKLPVIGGKKPVKKAPPVVKGK